MVREIRKMNKSVLFVDTTTSYYSQFTINGNTIKMVNGYNNQWYQILMREVISTKKRYNFKIKLSCIPNRYLLVGVVDRLSGKNNSTSQEQNYAIGYTAGGQVYPSHFGAQGGGFSQGEVVEVKVDLSKGKVEFKVSESVRATINNYSVLMEKNR
jgi:hypothetical protein